MSNRHSPITIVAAISSQFDDPLCPTEILLQPPDGGLAFPAVVLLNQVRSVETRRLVRQLGTLTPARMDRVDRAIRISLGLVEI